MQADEDLAKIAAEVSSRTQALLDAFTRAMRAEGRGVCLVAVSEWTSDL